MANATHLWVKTADVSNFTKEWSGNGIRYSLRISGERAVLESLAELVHTGSYTSLKDVADYCGATEVSKSIPQGVRPRTPLLTYSGQGLIAELTIGGLAGLKEGNSTIGYDEETNYNVPGGATCRIVYEPNDVDIKYGLPFRAGMKWDLERTLADAGYTNLPAGFNDIDVNKHSLLAMCNAFESNSWNSTAEKWDAIEWFESKATLNEWIRRYLRGETNYRTWIPTVTVTRQYRTMPAADKDEEAFPKPGVLCHPLGTAYYQKYYTLEKRLDTIYVATEFGPPAWTQAPLKDSYGNDFFYLRGASQLEFNGDGWSVETQWSGFLEFDAILYSSPKP